MPKPNYKKRDRAYNLFTKTNDLVKDIARKVGINPSTIYSIANAENWWDDAPHRTKRSELRTNPISLSEKQIEEIRDLYDNSSLIEKAIAKRFNLSEHQFRYIKQKYNFKERTHHKKYDPVKMTTVTTLRRFRTCQFPLWDQELPHPDHIDEHMCGAARKEGSSYCEKHHKVCYQQAELEGAF